MPPPTTFDEMKCRIHGTTVKVCHREGQRPVAISWYNVRICRQYQEIATPSARNDCKLWRDSSVLPGQLSSRVGGVVLRAANP